ncbi:hypothetical protein CRG98_048121, partial [Punica granatum]
RIPPAYRKHMKGKDSGDVHLKGPSGYCWPARLTKESGNLYLARGWPAFVRDHGIQRGHFLLFRFDGETTLKVKVFSGTACEDKAAFGAKPSRGNGNDPRKPREELVAKVREEDGSGHRAEKVVLQEPGPSTSTFPSFTKKLKAYSVVGRERGKTLVIDSTFAKIHFVKPRMPIVLRWEDKEWPVIVTKSSERYYLRGGWPKFVKESKVQEGDTCKFELVDRFVLRVHVLKCVEEE